MKTQILAFTNTSYAYEQTEELAISSLKNELSRRNAKSNGCWIFDVTNIPDNSEIEHENGIVTFDNTEHVAEYKLF